jgi:hypothetical protein
MGVEPHSEGIEALVHTIEPGIHARDQGVEPSVYVVEPSVDVVESRVDVVEPRVDAIEACIRPCGKRIDLRTEVEERAEGRRGEQPDRGPDDDVHLVREGSTGR